MKSSTESFVFACKTYKKDIEVFKRLVDSYSAYNIDNIKLIVIVPRNDVEDFTPVIELLKANISLVEEESFAKEYMVTEPVLGLSPGYINQEICKLSFWETGIADNVLFIDSDTYFIRKFYISDFMASESVPYSVLTMDKDLHTEKFYKAYGRERKLFIEKIFKAVELNDNRLLTCHGMTVLSSKVLEDFKKRFMNPRNLTYADILEISPFEYTWYNAWLQKAQVIPVLNCEPFFKTFHMREEYSFARIRQITQEDLASQYVGIVLNSNWQRKGPPDRYEKPNLFMNLVYSFVSKLG